MKQSLIFALILSFLLTACASATATPIVSTVMPIPFEPTLTETLTPKPTETPIPPLESLSITQESVSQFASAMQKAGINITAEQILQQGLQIQTITGADGKKYEIANVHLDPDSMQQREAMEGNYPMMIREKGREWEKADRNLATVQGKEFGALLTGFWVLDPNYKGREFMGMLGNYFNGQASADLMWASGAGRDLHTSENVYDFSVPDAVVKNAQKNGLKVNFQSMFWGDPIAYPKWLNSINNKDDFLRVTSGYVDTISKRYSGKVNSYVLVNEFFGYLGYEGQKGNLFQKQLKRLDIPASDFIASMSEIIHKNDPSAHIMINDSGIEMLGVTDYFPERAKLTDQLLTDLKAKPNSFVDTVGFQMHLNASDFTNKNDVAKHYLDLASRIDSLKQTGYRVQVTEMDVRMNDLRNKSPEEQAKIQGDIYYNLVLILLRAGVDNIDFWGIQDGDSFLEKADWLQNPLDSNPLLFDDKLNPKAAYYSVLRACEDFAKIGN